MLRTIALTATAMVAFAANSVLARLALAGSAIGDLGYTGWRLASGAVVLFLLSRLIGRRDGAPALAGGSPQPPCLAMLSPSPSPISGSAPPSEPSCCSAPSSSA